jgi:hypothetical protein
MSWTTPKTWGSGDILTKADLDTHVRDNLNFLKVNIALDTPSELTIATGVVTKTASHHTIDTESDAASDDLDTIAGGSEGDVLFIRPANAARVVTIKHGVGNIQCNSGADITLYSGYTLLIYDGATWWVIGVSAVKRSFTRSASVTVGGAVSASKSP